MIGHACMMTLSDVIDVPDLPALGPIAHSAPSQQQTMQASTGQSLADHEKQLVVQALNVPVATRAKRPGCFGSAGMHFVTR